MRFVTLYNGLDEKGIALNITPLSCIEHRSENTIKVIVDDEEYDTGYSLGYKAYAIWFPDEIIIDGTEQPSFQDGEERLPFEVMAEALIKADFRLIPIDDDIIIMTEKFEKSFKYNNFIGTEFERVEDSNFTLTFMFVEDKQLKRFQTYLTQEHVKLWLESSETMQTLNEHVDEDNHMIRTVLVINQVFSEDDKLRKKKIVFPNLKEI